MQRNEYRRGQRPDDQAVRGDDFDAAGRGNQHLTALSGFCALTSALAGPER